MSNKSVQSLPDVQPDELDSLKIAGTVPGGPGRLGQLRGLEWNTLVENIPESSEVRGVQFFENLVDSPITVLREYQNTQPYKRRFEINFYSNADNFNRGIEMPESERPTGIVFNPQAPVQDNSIQIVSVTFTLQSAGTILVRLRLV